jgi:membrane-associated protein
MWDFLKELMDPESIIQYGGLALLLFVVFAETGLLVGFFLPGDNLIFISGIICVSRPELLGLDIIPLILALAAAAIIGNIAGYAFGYKVGPALFKRDDSLLFKKKYVITTKAFYDKYGGATLIIGRFLPIVRTFAPILAGVIRIDFKKFMLYNISGALAWTGILGGAGYYLGQFQWVHDHLSYIIIGLIVITLIPLVVTYFKRGRDKNR